MGDTRGPYRQTGTKYRVNGGSIDASLNSFAIVDSVGSITVSYEYEHVFWDKKDNQMFEEDNYYTESVVQVTSSSETVSLIVILGRYYQAIKNKITELFDEFNWWGLAE